VVAQDVLVEILAAAHAQVERPGIMAAAVAAAWATMAG